MYVFYFFNRYLKSVKKMSVLQTLMDPLLSSTFQTMCTALIQPLCACIIIMTQLLFFALDQCLNQYTEAMQK